MNGQDLSKAKSPELRASMAALQRAAALARKTAIQTDTDLVIVKNGELRRLSARQLRLRARKDKTA
jgi:hypothetical protein